MILLAITIIFFIDYSILLIYYWRGWKQAPEFKAPEKIPSTKVSVVIPARNEEKNIGKLLKALEDQVYPKNLLEVIVVDDDSTDETRSVVQRFPNVILVSQKEENINSYKKKAIEAGIGIATGDLIVTTDADCEPSLFWLKTIALYKESNSAVLIVAPVITRTDPDARSNLVSIFESIDFMMLQGITGASVSKKFHSMCNGANLAYEKKVFYEVGGFDGIDDIASGDDMLLMHKIARKFPSGIFYLKSQEAVVNTSSMRSLRDFFRQRIRWASKATKYDDKRIILALVLVYLFNVLFPVLLLAGCWNYNYWLLAAAYWTAKTLVELPFAISLAQFFKRKRWIPWLFILQPLHTIYMVVSGLFGQFGSYSWKGRKVR